MRMGQRKGDWKLGCLWVLGMLFLMWFFLKDVHAEERVVVRPSVVMWHPTEGMKITLTVLTDKEALKVFWGDGETSYREVDGSVTMEHRYKRCAPTMRITVILAWYEGEKEKHRKVDKEFHVVGCD